MINLLLSIGIGAALAFYFKVNMIIAIVACFAVLTLVNGGLFEGFSSGIGDTSDDADDSRIIKYGDTIAIWTWTNTYLTALDSTKDISVKEDGKEKKGLVGTSTRLPKPSDLPRGWINEFWVIEDANDQHAGPGNRGPVKFGDKVYLRSWRSRYLSADANGGIFQSASQYKRGNNEQFVMESPEISAKNGAPIKYGNMIRLGSWRNTFVSVPEGTSNVVQLQNTDEAQGTTSITFRLYDHYGEGGNTDWARRGVASQSSNYGHYPASNAVDGNFMSFSHTQKEQGAWWQIRLPKDVNVDTITIKNRQDCCKDRIKNFDVILITDSGDIVMTKNFPNVQDEYQLTGVNRTGRIVKIQLRDNNYLHIAEVRVYGKGVDYSTLLEKPVVTEIVSQEQPITENTSKNYFNNDLPYVGAANSASITGFIKFGDSNEGNRNIFDKGGMPSMSIVDGVLSVQMKTTKVPKLNIQTTHKPVPNKWTHFAVVIKDGIAPTTGWSYGQFSKKPAGAPSECCYAVNPALKQYYYLQKVGVFADVPKNTWDPKLVSTMQYMGELDASNVAATAEIFINGKRDVRELLEGRPVFNKLPLRLGKSGSLKGANCVIKEMKFYNFGVSSKVIQKESSYSFENSIYDLLRGEHDASQVVTIEPHILPTLKDQSSVSFWIYSDRSDTGTRKWDTIFVKGNKDNERAPAMSFHPTSNQISAPVSNFGGAFWGDGVETVKVPIKAGGWYHITEVLKNKTQTIYINGKMTDQATLPGAVTYTVSPMKIGGFQGKIKDFKLYNFSLEPEEVVDYMGRHPYYKYQKMVQSIWNNSGCIADLFSADPSAHASWVALMKDGQQLKLEEIFKGLKQKAQNGDKESQQICFGPHASGLYQSLSEKDELLKYALDKKNNGKKCLPTAPFKCDVKSINDFDIRTHNDFYKYTLTDRIIPPAQSPSDYNIKDHPDFAAYQKQLDNTKQSLREMTRIRAQEEKKNNELSDKLNRLTSQKGLTENAVKSSPIYQELAMQVEESKQKLQSIDEEQRSTAAALMDAEQKCNVTANPKYIQMASDLQKTRKLAATNLAQSLDLDTLQKNPTFKKILDDMLKGSQAEGESVLSLSQGLRQQRAQLDRITNQTLRELDRTKQMADDVYTGVAGLTPEMVKNIIQSKENLSNNPKYQEIIKQMKGYCSNMNIQEHPEFQEMVKTLNDVTQGEVDAGSLPDLMVQANKCKALFENSEEYATVLSTIPDKVLLDVLNSRMHDAEFGPLVKHILKSECAKDPNLNSILDRAEDEGRTNDPAYKAFVEKLIKTQILKNPVYREMLIRALDNSEYAGQVLSEYRIEDHPEYNKYAKEMKQQCMESAGNYDDHMKSIQEEALYGKAPASAEDNNLSCYSCKLK